MKETSLLHFLKKISYKLIFFIGIISTVIFLFATTYYFTSGMYYRFKPNLLIQTIDRVIFDRYLGFSVYEIDNYLKKNINVIKYNFVKNELTNVELNIDQENLEYLEIQRQNKIKQTLNKVENFAKGNLIHDEKNYKIKLRVKGDRVLHYFNKNETSYKIDLRGDERLWGLEEFSVQKPIVRNYTYEYIFHKLLNYSDLISLKYFFINIALNGSDKGIYAVEEGFSKELIERNKKRNGPIFGLDEKKGTDYPYIKYDLYSKKYWTSNYPELVEQAIIKINSLKEKKIGVNEIFDLEKWATFFAIIDLSSTLHGSISKSVKLFYNPVTSKFEPIGYDGHYRKNHFENFLILDFLDKKNKNCSYICKEREWYLSFLKKPNGDLNNEFITLYLEALKRVSSINFIEDFYKKNSKKFDKINSQLHTEKTKKDRGFYKGVGEFIYEPNFLKKKALYINERINKIGQVENLEFSLEKKKIVTDNANKFFFKELVIDCKNLKKKQVYLLNKKTIDYGNTCDYFIGESKLRLSKDILIRKDLFLVQKERLDLIKDYNIQKKDKNNYYINSNIVIDRDTFFPKGNNLYVAEGVEITFTNDVILRSEGSIFFKGSKERPIIVQGGNKINTGSLILTDNSYLINHVIFKNLSFPKTRNSILYGGVNIINSNLEINNSQIINSLSEDGINIISSKSKINNLILKNIYADAIDIDFGTLDFVNINCNIINNDCLDVSGANVKGNLIKATNVQDKGLSFGENSVGIIKNNFFKNNKLAVAVKDGSELEIINNTFIDNKYDIAVFNKKKEYDNATLILKDNSKKFDLNILLGKKNILISDQKYNVKKKKNKFINNLFY